MIRLAFGLSLGTLIANFPSLLLIVEIDVPATEILA